MASCSFSHPNSYGSSQNPARIFTLTVNDTAGSVNPSANTSSVDWTVTVSGGNGSDYYNSYVKAIVNGTVVYDNTATWQQGVFPAKNGSVSGTLTDIVHDNDGTKTISFYIEGYSYEYTVRSADGSLTLQQVPRYFSSTPIMEVTSKTTKTVTIKWTAPENASRSQYRIGDSGSWVDVETGINKKTGTMTISGLTANTSYRIYGDFMKADSGLWCQTKPYVDVKTYDYAKISSAPDFNDEGNPKITYTNPLGNIATTLQARIENSTGTSAYVEYRNINKTGTLSYTFNFTTTERNTLRSACSNSSSPLVVKFVIKTVVDGTTYWSTVNKTMSIVNGNPTFTDFAYADTNTTVSNLIGTNQALVQGKSNLQVTISSANKMVAIKQASPKNYTASIDNKTIPANYSTNDVVIDMGTISSSGTQRLTVTAYDSRDNFTPQYKDITIYEYKKPVVNATVERLNNFENQTTLSIDGEYSKLVVGGEAKNTILNGSYKYRETGGNWTDPNPLLIIATDGRFYCDNVILSLDNSKSFEFEVSITDELDTTTVSLTLDIGKAIFFISSNLHACFVDGYLDVDGDIRYYGNSIVEYSTSEKRIGKWVDGKPLYRKVITTTETVANDSTIYHYIDNVDLIYITRAFIYGATGLCWDIPIDLYGTGGTNTTDRLNLYVDRNVIGFKCDTSWGSSWTKVIILEYTKTTD